MPGFSQWLNSYKNRNMLLFGAAAIMLVLCFRISISKTLNTRSAYFQKKQLIQQVQQQDLQLEQLAHELNALKAGSIKAYDRKELLRRITQFCKANDLLVQNFPEAQYMEVAEHGIFTNELQLSGGYQDIVSLAYLIEQKERRSVISSLQFYLQKNKKTKVRELHARLILRNLKT